MLVSCTYVCVFRFFGRLFSSDWREREREREREIERGKLLCVFSGGVLFLFRGACMQSWVLASYSPIHMKKGKPKEPRKRLGAHFSTPRDMLRDFLHDMKGSADSVLFIVFMDIPNVCLCMVLSAVEIQSQLPNPSVSHTIFLQS